MFLLILMLSGCSGCSGCPGCSGCIQGINESIQQIQQIQEQEQMLIPQTSNEVSGEQLFVDKGCFACHEYNTLTCPSLEGLNARGTFLGGKEKISAENLAEWLRNPVGDVRKVLCRI
jgi:cytochrome c551/c552